MTDRYDVTWIESERRYAALHERIRSPRSLRWSGEPIHPTPEMRSERKAWSSPRLPDVVMGTFGSYSEASRAIGSYPAGGPYARGRGE